jgi:hypothetical protein
MKRVLLLSLLTLLLGGCVVAPYGYRDDDANRYHGERSGYYDRDAGYYGYNGFRHGDHGG